MSKEGIKFNKESDQELKAALSQIAAEILRDPDFGKELSNEAKERLSSVTEKDLKEATPLSEIS